MPQPHTLSTTTVGRYLVEPATSPAGTDAPLLIGFHGYGQNAEALLASMQGIPGASSWTLVSVQALHRFYNVKTQEVVGSWMTSLDREQAIEDNVAYVGRVIEALRTAGHRGAIVFVGFSQGAAMAWRAAARCGPCAGVIVLGGDLPKDVAEAPALTLPPVLLGCGERDPFYSAAQLEKDEAALAARGVSPEVIRFDGGHAWDEAFLKAAGRFLDRVRSS
jgi:predicted esterase